MRKLLMLLSVVGSVFSISHSVQAAGRDLYNAGSGDGAISCSTAPELPVRRASPASRRDGPISPEPPVVAYCSTTPRPDSARPPESTMPATTLLFAASPASRLDGPRPPTRVASLLQRRNRGRCDLPARQRRELPVRAEHPRLRDGMDPYHLEPPVVRIVLQRLDRTSARPPIDNAGNYACSQHPRLRDWMDPHHVRRRGGLLYNAGTGDGAISLLDSAGNYRFVQSIPGFATGWTHITGTAGGGVLFYNASTGLRRDRPNRQCRQLHLCSQHPRLRDWMDPHRGTLGHCPGHPRASVTGAAPDNPHQSYLRAPRQRS